MATWNLQPEVRLALQSKCTVSITRHVDMATTEKVESVVVVS